MKRIVAFLLAAAYVIWPLDLIADIIPIFGQIDDVIAATTGLFFLFRRR